MIGATSAVRCSPLAPHEMMSWSSAAARLASHSAHRHRPIPPARWSNSEPPALASSRLVCHRPVGLYVQIPGHDRNIFIEYRHRSQRYRKNIARLSLYIVIRNDRNIAIIAIFAPKSLKIAPRALCNLTCECGSIRQIEVGTTITILTLPHHVKLNPNLNTLENFPA